MVSSTGTEWQEFVLTQVDMKWQEWHVLAISSTGWHKLKKAGIACYVLTSYGIKWHRLAIAGTKRY